MMTVLASSFFLWFQIYWYLLICIYGNGYQSPVRTIKQSIPEIYGAIINIATIIDLSDKKKFGTVQSLYLDSSEPINQLTTDRKCRKPPSHSVRL